MSVSSSIARSLSRNKILKFQNDLFSSHKSRIIAAHVPRIEKIEVQYRGRNIADDAVMILNKGLSTPQHCASHTSLHHAKNSILALVKKKGVPDHDDGAIVSVKDSSDDGGQSSEIVIAEKPESRWTPWDMHRPLEDECEVKLLNFAMSQATAWESRQVNLAYWRSCALLLGAVAQEAFEDELTVKLANLPNTSIESGAFSYDIELDKSLLGNKRSEDWQPDKATLISLTKTARHILSQNLQFERLVVKKEIAQEIFQHNEHHLRRVENGIFPSIRKDKIPLYRFGRYIDICEGPLIPNTSFIYHFVVTAVHQLMCAGSGTCLWRFQGLSLPKQSQVHHAVWSKLEHRARKLVKQDLPFEIMESSLHNNQEPFHKYRSIENETKQYNISTGQWLQDKWKSSNEKLSVPP